MSIKERAKQTLYGLVALLASAFPMRASATDIETGLQYKQGIVSPMVSVSQAYKTGKVVFVGKIEKVKESPLDFQLTGIYPLGKGYSFVGAEEVGVDPSFEPLYYLTRIGVRKGIGKGSVSVSGGGFKPASGKMSYSGSIASSYQLGKKVKLSTLGIIPVKSPTKSTIRAGLSYSL